MTNPINAPHALSPGEQAHQVLQIAEGFRHNAAVDGAEQVVDALYRQFRLIAEQNAALKLMRSCAELGVPATLDDLVIADVAIMHADGYVAQPEEADPQAAELALAVAELSLAMGSPTVYARLPATLRSETVRLAASKLAAIDPHEHGARNFDAVAKAMRLADMLAGSVAQNNVEMANTHSAQLRSHLIASLSPQCPAAVDQHPDDIAVDKFAAQMKWKLAQKRRDGRSGWQDSAWTPEQISQALREHAAKSDPVDVANYCMFLSARGQSIIPDPAGVAPAVEIAPGMDGAAPKARYFSFSEDAGFDTHMTQEEAIEAAQSDIDTYRNEAGDGWPDGIDSVCWGVIWARPQAIDLGPAPEGAEFDRCVDFKLKAVAQALRHAPKTTTDLGAQVNPSSSALAQVQSANLDDAADAVTRTLGIQIPQHRAIAIARAVLAAAQQPEKPKVDPSAVASIYISASGDREFDDWKCELPAGRNILYTAAHTGQQAVDADLDRPTREDLIAALTFYADGSHFVRHQLEAWDTVSGEPENYFEDDANTATVEDGSVARMALDGKLAAASFDDVLALDETTVQVQAADALPDTQSAILLADPSFWLRNKQAHEALAKGSTQAEEDSGVNAGAAASQLQGTDSMGIPKACGGPLCNSQDHHPLCAKSTHEQSLQAAQPAPGRFSLVPSDILDRFPEINPSNYDHDDACALNAWGVEVVLAASKGQSA